ncbi:MAG: hypothetical protein R3274_05535 [Desulfobacterales bacterium]|nr:hypothetical protein [Desulfobacterales bacterium]
MVPIYKIDFFDPKIWQEGALLEEIQRCLEAADDLHASGRWQSAAAPEVSEAYRQTLGGRPIEEFDPDGYLYELGLETSLTAGRTNAGLLRAFHLIKAYRPDPRYFPFSKKAGALIQRFFLTISRFAPGPAMAIDRILDPVAVRYTEKSHNTHRYRSAPFGRFEDIAKGALCELSKEKRYLGILRKQMRQYAWDRGPHAGSIDPGRRADENFGAYDTAVHIGFSRQQARRIAIQCYDVDISRTHYRDPQDAAKPRTTGTIGDIGDIQRHYNRSPAGQEDTSIKSARIHLARAHRLADEGFYDAAEKEFAIGLHSLQDIFSHAQLTPAVHTCLGEFPDLVKYHPLAMFETAVATEGYFKKFIAGLNLKPLEPVAERLPADMFSDSLLGGTASPNEQALISEKLNGFPAELIAFLKKNGVRIFVAAAETSPTDLGFGVDLDGDGRITPGRWVDVSQDGQQQWFEVEDQFDDGKIWAQQPAAYNHHNRFIFISARILNAPEFGAVLKHEINHAIDCSLQDDSQLGAKWQAYLDRLYKTARRRGMIAFDELDKHEYFAQTSKLS